ncbi:MAG TPA: glutathione S-transferase N-terminal domain-containing protein [Candidatus Binatia bacterium]|nr:glutathione S-transferase N-terminal domain-containing protein [Candidatus Binatia bacterium]
MSRTLDVVTSFAASVARAGAGMAVGTRAERPARPLVLYEFEACPYCRKVREALSILDLDVLIRPCPRGGPRFREEVRRQGGRVQLPYLVDPNAGRALYESDDIVRHLFAAYGDGNVPALLALPVVTDVTSGLASLCRPTRGRTYRAARHPERPLELWSFEASPYCRLVREALCELELEYVLHNVAQGSPQREAFVARSGRMQVPYLADPNTGAALFESADIVRYLDRTYAS